MRIALSLSVYEHAAKLINASPWDVSRSPELLYQAHKAAYELYQHTPLVVGIDIYNLEAEAYGAAVRNPGGCAIPAITEPLFPSLEAALEINPLGLVNRGRIIDFLKTAKRLKHIFPQADIRLPLSGPFSIAHSLLGLENLIMGALTDAELTRRFLLLLVHGQVEVIKAVCQEGIGLAFFESAAAPPLLSPAAFTEVELPALNTLLQSAKKVTGQALPCIIGGNTQPIIDQIISTGTEFVICPPETNQEAFLESMKKYPEVSVRVNMDAEIYVRGTQADIAAEVDRILALGKGRKNLLLGTGAIPYETNPENILFLKNYCAGH